MDFIHWFRDSSPYFAAHRGQTFVIHMAGQAFEGNLRAQFEDIRLLHHLGVNIVWIMGSRPQISKALEKNNLTAEFSGLRRVTSSEQLDVIIDATNRQKTLLEAQFSASKTPVNITQGSFVVARPLGVLNGLDHLNTGVVRKINAQAIQDQLDANCIPLLTALNYSLSGDIFNCSTEEIAVETAVALKADKLIFIADSKDCEIEAGHLSLSQAKSLSNSKESRLMKRALRACELGIERIHILDVSLDGALLQELYTREGVGILISNDDYYRIRAAELADIPDILSILEPLEEQGFLVARSREAIESQIHHYHLIEMDSKIVGCAALIPYEGCDHSAELSALAIHTDYRQQSLGDQLLKHIEAQALNAHITDLFALTTQTTHWFVERGFELVDVDALPESRRAVYNPERNSKCLKKKLRA